MKTINKIKKHLIVSTVGGIKTENGIWCIKPLSVEKCKIGMTVLTKAGSLFKVEEIAKNSKRKNDLTVVVGNGAHGCTYGSYNGFFPSLSVTQ